MIGIEDISMSVTSSEAEAIDAAEAAVQNIVAMLFQTCPEFQNTFAMHMMAAIMAVMVNNFGPRHTGDIMRHMVDEVQMEN